VVLKKPSQLFESKNSSKEVPAPVRTSSPLVDNFNETFDRFKNNLDKVEELNEKVNIIVEDLNKKLSKEDLEGAIFSHLVVVEENFRELESQFESINKNTLKEFNKEVSQLAEILEELVEDELPEYKKKVTETEIKISQQFNSLQNSVHNTFEDYEQTINEKIVEFENFSEKILNLEKEILQRVEEYKKINLSFNKKVENYNDKIESFKDEVRQDISSVKLEVGVNEQHLKKVEKFFQQNHQELLELKEEVYGDIEKLTFGNIQENIQRLEKKIDFIRETYSKIEPEVIVKEVIKEGLLNESSSTKNEDPLTPLDQNFVTLDQLQEHYRLFINRIQQQLSTLGGGGETQLKYLDDIVGIATNASAYDGKYLKYNHSLGKFEFDNVDITNDSWSEGINGPYTNGSVGIGTSVANCELDIIGNVCVTGVVTATDFNSLSDLKLKENVEIISSPIDSIMKIEGVNFNWKETGKLSMGVIAQQLEETLPQLISGEEIKTVNYNGLIGLLIEVVKDQQKQIDELKRRLDK